jgi:hypothetical protein
MYWFKFQMCDCCVTFLFFYLRFMRPIANTIVLKCPLLVVLLI